MLVALTGLHAAGKSYFTNNIPPELGFEVYDKKDIVKQLCEEEGIKNNQWCWYQEEYNKNPRLTTCKILSKLPLEKNVILDSVHSYKEWKIIQSVFDDSALIFIVTTEKVREKRWEIGDQQKDKTRMEYWHSEYEGERGCLLSEASWALNGAVSLETNISSFLDFINCYNLGKNQEHPLTFIKK